MLCVIAATRGDYKEFPKTLEGLTNCEFVFVGSREALTLERLQALKPRYIFFPHWSYLIPEEIFTAFECVIFHMTDVPFGRGGSPLQNLVARGIYDTKLTALQCVAELDAGPVYQKLDLNLNGTAEEIYRRASVLIRQMIIDIVTNQPQPKPQQGEVVSFHRRTPRDGDLKQLSDLDKVYDFIRMLDAEGYPRAFLETDHFRFEFERASLKPNVIHADVKIYRKDQ